MLENHKIFNQLRHRISLILLAGLIFLMSLPTTPVQAAGYYSKKNHEIELSRPYYITKERRVLVQTEPAKPYYSTKNRQKEKVIIKTPAIENNDIKIDQREGEIMPRNAPK